MMKMHLKIAGLLTFGLALACAGGEEAEEAEEKAEEKAEAKPDDSKPLNPVTADQSVGSMTVSAEICAIDGVEFLGDSNMSLLQSVVVSGDRVMIVDKDGKVRGYTIEDGEGCTLAVDEGFGDGGVLSLEKEVKWLSAADNGRVVASSGVFDAYVIDGGELAYACDASGYHEIHSSGSWGIAHFVGSTVKKVTYTDSGCSSEDWGLANLSSDDDRKGNFTSVNSAGSFEDGMLVGGPLAGSVAAEETRVVGVFDDDGKELRRFGGSDDLSSDEGFGWIHALGPCEPGVCVLDSNFRRLTVWGDDGKFIGSVDLSKLMGLGYPWIADIHAGADGYHYAVAANDREDSDVAEGFIYRIAGLGEARAADAGDKGEDKDEESAGKAGKGGGKAGKGGGKRPPRRVRGKGGAPAGR